MSSRRGVRKIAQNLGSLITGKVLGDAITFVFFVVLSRAFGQDGIGKYSFAIGLTGFLAVLADFGISSLSIKEMSRIDGSVGNYFGRILCVRFFLTFIVVAAMFALLPLLEFSYETKVIIAIIGIYQIAGSLLGGHTSLFIARQDMHLVGVIEVSRSGFSALFGIILIQLGYGIVVALCALPIVTIVHVLGAHFIVVRKYGKPEIAWNLSEIRKQLKEAIPYGSLLLLNQINTRLDVILLGFFLTIDAVGIYNVGYRIVFMTLFIPRFVGTVLFPIASRFYSESQLELEHLYKKSLNYSCLIGLPAAAGLWLIAPQLVVLLFGEAFSESATVLRYLILVLFLTFFKSIMGVFLTSCDRQEARRNSQFFTACIMIVAAPLLIFYMGIRGAAIATLLSEVLVVALFAYHLRGILGWPKLWPRVAIGGFGTAAFLAILSPFEHLPLFFVIPSAAIIYLGTLLLFTEIRKNELCEVLELSGFRN
jgi:O-antigen/teichoic acid export membrane protein